MHSSVMQRRRQSLFQRGGLVVFLFIFAGTPFLSLNRTSSAATRYLDTPRTRVHTQSLPSDDAYCECSFPGSLQGGENTFTCTDPAYDGACEINEVCLARIGHAWRAGEKPACGSPNDADILRKYGAYEPIDTKSACARTISGVDTKNAHLCSVYEELELSTPDCSGKKTIVPKILHSVGSSTPHFSFSLSSAANQDFVINRHDDKTAIQYIFKKCGSHVAEAYACLTPTSYRADLFRFCALYADGGVYLDEDIVPLHPLTRIVSMCSVATIGHDFPANNHPAKQMKILSAAPDSPIMKCAMDSIVQNVKGRAYPDSPLELTGPLMLQKCYEKHSADVAITYIDTRSALWPYSGMRAGDMILAYEYPISPKHFCKGKECEGVNDYERIYKARKVYSAECRLNS